MVRTGFAAIGWLMLGTAMAVASPSAAAQSAPRWLLDARSNCYVLDADPTPADTVAWSGDCSGNRAEGDGTAVFSHAGRGVLTVSGTFTGGVASGEISANWADGSHYQGSAAAGRLNGPGMLVDRAGNRFQGQWASGDLSGPVNVVWADGRHYEGNWKNGQPDPHAPTAPRSSALALADTASTATNAALTAPAVAPVPRPSFSSVRSSTPTEPTYVPPPAAAPALVSGTAITPVVWLDGMADHKLITADGSTMRFSVSAKRITREIMEAGAPSRQVTLALLNDRQGTVLKSADGSDVIGLFQIEGNALKIQFADGSSETSTRTSDNGLMLLTAGPGAPTVCTMWYREGHQFTLDERRAAVAAYAVRLGVSTPAQSDCAPPSTLQADVAKTEPLAGKPSRPSRTRTAALLDANFRADPVALRTSEIHPIDPAPPAEQASQPSAPARLANADAAPKTPTQCLSVEAKGRTWGFRNHCDYAVRFAYCLNEPDAPLSACQSGATPGLVPANTFGRLFSDDDTRDIEHQFRWIACPGDDADVVPRMLRTDPPAGQCVNTPALTASKGPPP